MIIFLGFCSISRIRVGNHHLIDYRGWTWRVSRVRYSLIQSRTMEYSLT
ncbi:hypothetical protein AT1G19396 [Arabidopsis thaliana]|uniref:Uncharacterized protein n=1 Tax=Arabidopsis thaliana TaxID=3702 RepID=F4HP56_ARATH|nr:uncharacterized protein AT1G19396 [Arabidopsis thaliana]AEE29845.1 hypothetical protein AT1G19396 [Arabidopsis thaliana]|eukprot:NP_001185035.1 hypothetical protein AT1G19396 [Arabidopsis thaliana]